MGPSTAPADDALPSVRPRRARAAGLALLAIPLAGMAYLAVGAVELSLAPARPGPGEPAPALVATTLDGQRFELASLQGQVVLVDFWATWCAGCTTWLPIAQRLQRDYASRGLVVVGASIEHEDAAAVQRVVAERRLEHPQIIVGPEVQARFGTYQLPTYWLVDREGRVAGVWRGAFDEVLARKAIERALEVPAPQLTRRDSI